MTLVRPAGAADAEASVRTIRAGHLSDVTVNVVEREAGAMEGVRVARAWVFHDDIFIFISEDHRLYTSVEVKCSFIYNKRVIRRLYKEYFPMRFYGSFPWFLIVT